VPQIFLRIERRCEEKLFTNVYNCQTSKNIFFNPLLYRLSYQAKTWGYNELAWGTLKFA
jgi:hypothetical protein